MWREPIVLFLVLVCCGQLNARNRDDVIGRVETIAEKQPAAVATEVEDLLAASNSPGKKETSKEIKKNSSGKSDEGGYYKTYGSDTEGEKGYLKATYSKGNHGYKTLDTFHKQDGDKYAFEKQVAYGKARADKKSSHNDEAASRSSEAGDHESAGTMVDTHYANHEGDQNGSNEQAEASDHEGYTAEDSGHYTDHGPESSSYGHSEGYADADGEHGSYESHSSYSKSSGGEHGSGGSHYY